MGQGYNQDPYARFGISSVLSRLAPPPPPPPPSMIEAYFKNRLPYQYNAPSLAQLFPQLSSPMMPSMGMGGSGAGRFAGGLLSEAPVNTASSGAGRFA